MNESLITRERREPSPFPHDSPAAMRRAWKNNNYRVSWRERLGFIWLRDGTDRPPKLRWRLWHFAFAWQCRVPDGLGWFDHRGAYCWPWQFWPRYYAARKAVWR